MTASEFVWEAPHCVFVFCKGIDVSVQFLPSHHCSRSLPGEKNRWRGKSFESYEYMNHAPEIIERENDPRRDPLQTVSSDNSFIQAIGKTDVYFNANLFVKHKSLCPRHELDVTDMVVINANLLVMVDSFPCSGNSFPLTSSSAG